MRTALSWLSLESGRQEGYNPPWKAELMVATQVPTAELLPQPANLSLQRGEQSTVYGLATISLPSQRLLQQHQCVSVRFADWPH